METEDDSKGTTKYIPSVSPESNSTVSGAPESRASSSVEIDAGEADLVR